MSQISIQNTSLCQHCSVISLRLDDVDHLPVLEVPVLFPIVVIIMVIIQNPNPDEMILNYKLLLNDKSESSIHPK